MAANLDYAIGQASSASVAAHEAQKKIDQLEHALLQARSELQQAQSGHAYWLKQVVASATEVAG